MTRCSSSQVTAVIEAASESDTRLAASAVGVTSLRVVVRGEGLVHHRALAEAAFDAGAGAAGVVVGLTGGAQLIQGVRALLRERVGGAAKVKAYWAPGRVGLD